MLDRRLNLVLQQPHALQDTHTLPTRSAISPSSPWRLERPRIFESRTFSVTQLHASQRSWPHTTRKIRLGSTRHHRSNGTPQSSDRVLQEALGTAGKSTAVSISRRAPQAHTRRARQMWPIPALLRRCPRGRATSTSSVIDPEQASLSAQAGLIRAAE